MILSELRDGTLVSRDVGEVVFDDCYEVIVAGLGTSGSMAAVMSAQNGLKVLGIEKFNAVGGTTTMTGIQWHYFGFPGGRYVDIDNVVNEFYEMHTRTRLESRKINVEKIITENGADILYESVVCGVYKQDDTVVGVRVITPDGIRDFASKVLMDCTGDIHVACISGCTFEYGRITDGLAQPYTVVSAVRNGGEIGYTNIDFGRVNQYDDAELSQALVFARSYEMDEDRLSGAVMQHMPLMGIREGRRIVAEETVRLADFFVGAHTDTPMFWSYADLDKHGWDIAFDGEELGDWAIGANLAAYNIAVPIPYKAVIPKGIDGILVPCRGLGVDRDISGCVRMVPDMKKLGEAAADIAYLAVKHNCHVREIPYDELRAMLIESGCLNRMYESNYRIDGVIDSDGAPLVKRDVHFMTDPTGLEKHLATDKPGEAIWSSKLMGERAHSVLIGLLDFDDENTSKHAAFALAEAGSDAGVGILRRMVAERDAVVLKDCRKLNQQRGCMAIYHLGRLADRGIVDTLIDIITDEDEILRSVYHCNTVGTRYKISDFNNEYFQFVTNAVVALIRIADAHTDLRDKISAALVDAFSDGTYYNRITTRPEMSSEGSMTLNIRDTALAAVKRFRE